MIAKAAQRMVDIANESLRIANTSKKLSTRIARLHMAKDKLSQLQQLAVTHTFIGLADMEGFMRSIQKIEKDLRAEPGFNEENRKYLASADPFASFLPKELH